MPAVAIAVAVLLAVAASSQAASDTAGHTTVEQTICAAAQPPAPPGCLPTSSRNLSTYYDLRLGPGEPYNAEELDPGNPLAKSGRDLRRASLLYFAQLTDFQLADEESPARVEFLDPDTNPAPFDAAWRPQEALQPQIDDQAIRQIDLLANQSPVLQGDGTAASMSLAITTGDSADNQQKNEVEQVVKLLEGGTVDPNSGSSNPLDYATCPPGTPGPSEAAKYTGVQDYNDYVEGADPAFYDPNDPRGTKWSFWPTYPGLMDKAEVPFQAEGLSVPSYVALGNHDGLVQGNQAANRGIEDVATGCQKEAAPSPDPRDLASTLQGLSPSYLTNLAASDPTKVMLVPPDPNRQMVSTKQYQALHGPPFASDPNSHGFGFVDPAEQQASNGAAAYYSWSPGSVPTACDAPTHGQFCFIALNTVGEGGITHDHSPDGNIDHPQFLWLEHQLQVASEQDELIVLFGHHAIDSLTNQLPDEAAPACTTNDQHPQNSPSYPPHDTNPGCDLDPRTSTDPSTGHVHLGEPSERQPGDSTETLAELLLKYPHVIAFVAGHSHVNRILACTDRRSGLCDGSYTGTGKSDGFWNIKTAAEADWPQQSRLIEVMDNADGTLSIFGTVVDHASAATAPPAGTQASDLSQSDLASVGRTFSYNDPQKGGGTGEGSSADRNVELLIRDPRHFPVPVGASPLRVSMVPAYQPCETGSANASHGVPLNFPSCNPPVQISSTVGVGQRSLGFARWVVCAANTSSPFCNPTTPTGPLAKPDVRLTGSITDVRCKLSSIPAGCSPGADYDPNSTAGPYTSGGNGSTQAAAPGCFPSGVSATSCLAGADLTETAEIPGSQSGATGTPFEGHGLRVTDDNNNGTGDSATMEDLSFPIPLDCLPTSDPSVGSSCGVNTTANALVPTVVTSGRKAVWQLGQIQIKDAGVDGVRGNVDDQVFAVQGIFEP